MKAVVFERYGVGVVREVPPPVPARGTVLVRVRAAAVNPMDFYFTSGAYPAARPFTGLTAPMVRTPGVDFAGVVEAVGEGVPDVRPGDEVFGGARGTFAEQVLARPGKIAPRPANLSFEQAAAMPVAGLTALQALRDHGRVRPGQHVLVNGAAGGVGTFAVQIAKALGAHVTAVCSGRNADLVRGLGADRVVDHTREDFTRGDGRFDLMLDIVGGRSFRECRRVLAPRATLVLIGGPRHGTRLGPIGHILGMRLGSLGSRHRVVPFVARLARADLLVLGELAVAGGVTPVVERTFDLTEASEAIAHVGAGHARGKVVVRVGAPGRAA